MAHLIAMDRYFVSMAVEDLQDLPASYPRLEKVAMASVCVAGSADEKYKKVGVEGKRETHPPAMAQQLSDEEWTECCAYSQRLDEYSTSHVKSSLQV